MNFVQNVATGNAQLLYVKRDDEWAVSYAKGAIHISVDKMLEGSAHG